LNQSDERDSEGLVECRENFDWIEGQGKYPGKFFEDAMTDLNFQCKLLEKLILRLWAIGLGLDDIDFLVKLYHRWDISKKGVGGLSNIRLNYYPPKDDLIKFKHVFEDPTPQPFSSLISFVFQDTMGGLQVRVLTRFYLQTEMGYNSNCVYLNVYRYKLTVVINVFPFFPFHTPLSSM